MKLEAEIRLIRWAESSTAGRTITIELPPDEGDGHPFKGFPTGHQHGQLFRMTFAPIGDDGKPLVVPEPPAEPAGEHKPSARSVAGRERYHIAGEPQKALTRAALLAKDARFWKWARENYDDARVFDETSAKAFIRERIGTSSLGLIADDAEVYRRYIDWETPYRMANGLMAEPR